MKRNGVQHNTYMLCLSRVFMTFLDTKYSEYLCCDVNGRSSDCRNLSGRLKHTFGSKLEVHSSNISRRQILLVNKLRETEPSQREGQSTQCSAVEKVFSVGSAPRLYNEDPRPTEEIIERGS
jgi:hypothetical protein